MGKTSNREIEVKSDHNNPHALADSIVYSYLPYTSPMVRKQVKRAEDKGTEQP
jgi:hypothetical protein